MHCLKLSKVDPITQSFYNNIFTMMDIADIGMYDEIYGIGIVCIGIV